MRLPLSRLCGRVCVSFLLPLCITVCPVSGGLLKCVYFLPFAVPGYPGEPQVEQKKEEDSSSDSTSSLEDSEDDDPLASKPSAKKKPEKKNKPSAKNKPEKKKKKKTEKKKDE